MSTKPKIQLGALMNQPQPEAPLPLELPSVPIPADQASLIASDRPAAKTNRSSAEKGKAALRQRQAWHRQSNRRSAWDVLLSPSYQSAHHFWSTARRLHKAENVPARN